MAMTSHYFWEAQTRRAPCSCADCSDCSIWDTWDEGILHLIAGDDGYCYSTPGKESGELYIILPDITTLVGTFCVTIMSTGNAVAVVRFESGAIYFGGVAFDGIYVDALGTACICWDGVNFIATGDVTGYNGS
mgnify:CR=1 FL=1